MRIPKPTRNKILVEPIKHTDDSVRGIIIPEAHRDIHPSIDCIVVAKGPQSKAEVNVGDRVLIQRFCGLDIKSDGKDFKIVDETELLAIIE